MKNLKNSNNIEKETLHPANTLILKECNTVQHAEKLKKELLSIFLAEGPIQIEGKNIKNIDITFIQLMYALKCSSIKENRQLHFNIQFNEALTSLLVHNGFGTFNEVLNK